MADAEGGGAFATDLGYLEKFFAKLERHASAMTDAGAASRLTGLLAEERARWAEIRALLEGKAPRSGSPPAAGEAAGERIESARPAPPGFTVGSLVKR